MLAAATVATLTGSAPASGSEHHQRTLVHLFVEPDHQKMGLGRLLLGHGSVTSVLVWLRGS